MDIKEWYSKLGKKSASLMSASERSARARNAANTRWKHANSKHTQIRETTVAMCKNCGEAKTLHGTKWSKCKNYSI